MAALASATRLTRRQLLQLGGIGALGLTLPQFLQASRHRREKSCIFIVQYGGCSQIDSFDLKPDAPAEIRGPFRPISTTAPGVRICEHLPRLAGLAHHYCLIRSMTHDNPGHDAGMHICMTGHSKPADDTPYYGSVVARLRPATRCVPSYVWLQNLAGDVQPHYLTGGFLGAAYSPLRIGTDLDNPSAPGFRVKVFDPPGDVPLERFHERQSLLERLDSDHHSVRPRRSDGAWRRFHQEAVDLVTSPRTRLAFDLEREPHTVRDRYGRHPLGQNLLMARRLIEAGVRLVTVVAWTGTPPGEKFVNVQTWDMHGPSAAPHLGSIFGTGAYGLGWALPRVDQALSALLTDLHDRGLLESTLVVMVGEFGRTPKIVKLGRDHWPACYTALVAGAGIRGGRVYGSSDRQAAYVRDNPVRPEDFGATLFHALDISPQTRLGADGFTQPASAGQPITALFG